MQVTIYNMYMYIIYIYFYNKIFLSSLFFWGDDPKGCCRSFLSLLSHLQSWHIDTIPHEGPLRHPKIWLQLQQHRARGVAPGFWIRVFFLSTSREPNIAQLGVNHKNVKDSGKNTKNKPSIALRSSWTCLDCAVISCSNHGHFQCIWVNNL